MSTYAYLCQQEEIANNFLLGSAVRALGKGWKLGIECSGERISFFKRFRELLQRKTQFQVCANDIESTHRFQLLLRAYPAVFSGFQANHVIDVVRRADEAKYDLISDVRVAQLSEIGVTAITGGGKGKTTLALGFAAQHILSRQKALIMQWFKEKKSGDLTWAINEHFFPELLKNPELMMFHPTGLGFFGSPTMDRVKGDKAYQQHRAKAYQGMEFAKKLILSGEYTCVVLDEFVDTVKEIAQNIEYPLIDLPDAQSFLAWVSQQPIQVIVTGRRLTDDWKQWIRTSIDITEVKHPWSTAHQGAVSGLDF